MPVEFKIYGYCVYFWSDEGDEPPHVHVCAGRRPQKNGSKVWLTPTPHLANNNSRIPDHDLFKIIRFIRENRERLLRDW